MSIFDLGHSGCKLEINGDYITKRAYNYPCDRLLKQAVKQCRYYYTDIINIRIPRVCEIGYDFFTMEYFNCNNLINFFKTATIYDLQNFVVVIQRWLDLMIHNSCEIVMPSSIILDKYNMVKPNDEYDYFFYKMPEFIKIPIGSCHGDLTFSNIMYSHLCKKFILIDFLDSFIESPIIDISKIRQDTKYFWTLFKTKETQNSRMHIVFQYLNNKLDYIINQYDWCEYLQYFDILNLMRILPYADHETKVFIMEQIQCVH